MIKKTLTLNIPQNEMHILNSMSESLGLSKTAIIRQALRDYQLKLNPDLTMPDKSQLMNLK